MQCSRCGQSLRYDQTERCWWDFAPLCGDCWERYGHCGHAEADQVNGQIRAHYAQQQGLRPQRRREDGDV